MLFQAAYQGVGVAIGALLLYTVTIRVLGSSIASLFMPLIPVFGVLLATRKGKLPDFTFATLVAEIGGQRLTPPRRSGLLAGVMRQELLDRGEVRERVLRPADLRRATRLWLANSVRGLVPVRLVRGD